MLVELEEPFQQVEQRMQIQYLRGFPSGRACVEMGQWRAHDGMARVGRG
jgi:hypothetical protein